MEWFLLIIAIIFELIATSLLKYSEGFTRLWPSLGTCLGYLISFAALSFCLKKMDVSVAYAIWSAAGITVMTIIGVLFFKESINPLKILSIGLIIVGVIGLNMSGASH